MKKLFVMFAMTAAMITVNAQTYHNLAGSNFTQNWTNTSLITTNDDWSGVASIRGFRGDGLTPANGFDPQIVTNGDNTAPVISINAQVDPNISTTGGPAECDQLADPVVALQGSGTADAPYLIIYLNTTNVGTIQVSYNLRDVDGSADNSIQPFALQYRIGTTGVFTNIPAGFVADASSGPNLATLVSPISLTLPAACENKDTVQLRIITANAAGSDEFIGVDDINIGGTLLPVELTSFTAISKGKNVELQWNTATEVNNFGFEIEKSTTPVSPPLEGGDVRGGWSKIGFVEGNGTTNSPKSYSFVDPNARGNVAYRLKQIDRDGQFEYSQKVEVVISQMPQMFALKQNYPNPFNPVTMINYQLPVNNYVTLKVYDALGREVVTLVNEVKEAGSYNAQFDGSKLSSGIYFYTLNAGEFSATKKLLLLK